jgi:hypothetical protein
MIIWSRWGIVVFLFVGLSVGVGFALQAALAPTTDSSSSAMNLWIGAGFILGAAGLWAFAKYLLPRLDKPTAAFVYHQLPEPVVDENGVRTTHRAVPVVNQETGQQIWTRPSSTFFFVPVRFWPYVIAAIGVLNVVIGLIGN